MSGYLSINKRDIFYLAIYPKVYECDYFVFLA
ncbi:MAG: hypothetical protein ACJAU1_000606 [Psychromonas sp.]|jgi:hypothetical protein